jgi:CheY-like chemotaxis protein
MMASDKNNISTGKKILVAEDNEVNLSMLLDMLSILKHKVIVARNGQEAIDLALGRSPIVS